MKILPFLLLNLLGSLQAYSFDPECVCLEQNEVSLEAEGGNAVRPNLRPWSFRAPWATSYELEVYNRWGQKVYSCEATNPNGFGFERAPADEERVPADEGS